MRLSDSATAAHFSNYLRLKNDNFNLVFQHQIWKHTYLTIQNVYWSISDDFISFLTRFLSLTELKITGMCF